MAPRGRSGEGYSRLRDTRAVLVDERLVEAIGAMFPDGDWVAALEDADGVAMRLDALRTIATDDLEVVMIGPGGFSGTFRGVDGLATAWRDWLAPFATYSLEVEPEVQAGDDVVVFFARQVGTPKGGS